MLLSKPRTDPAPASDAAFTPRRCPRCEYNLYGLAPLTACPECGWDPEEAALAAAAPADAPRRRAARCHIAGLALLFLALFWSLDVILIENTARGVGGNMPLINTPAPKFWAVPALRRTTGNHVSEYGLRGMHSLLVSVAAVWLLTVRRPGETSSLPFFARYSAALAGGAVLGISLATTAIWSGGGIWSRLLLVMLVAEAPITLLLWLRLRQLAPSNSLRRAATALALLIPALICFAMLILVWRYYAEAPPRGWDNFQAGVAAALAIYGAAAITVAIAGAVVAARLLGALLGEAFPSRSPLRGALAPVGRTLRRIRLCEVSGVRLRAALSVALILLLILAHVRTFEGINSYGFGAAQNRRLPLINYPGLKLSAVPIAEVALARSDYRYNSRVPYEAMIWTVVFSGALVTLTSVRRDVAPRLGRILGWGTLCMVGGSAGVLLALTQFSTPRPVTLTLEAALLIPMVEIPLTFLLHRWLAALALAHNRPSAAARLRLASYVVVVLQLGAVATLAFATLEHPRPFDLKDYSLALPLLTASAAYGATALALAVVSTAAVGSILAGLLAAAIPRRRRVAGREMHQAASPRLAVA